MEKITGSLLTVAGREHADRCISLKFSYEISLVNSEIDLGDGA